MGSSVYRLSEKVRIEKKNGPQVWEKCENLTFLSSFGPSLHHEIYFLRERLESPYNDHHVSHTFLSRIYRLVYTRFPKSVEEIGKI